MLGRKWAVDMAGCLKRFFSPGLRKIISLAVARTHHQNSAHMLSQQHATRATAKRAASSPRQSRITCSHSDMLRVLYSNLRLLAAVCCSDTSVGASRQPQFHGSTLARSRSGSLAPHETEPCSHAQLTFAHLEKPRTKLTEDTGVAALALRLRTCQATANKETAHAVPCPPQRRATAG